ncbi:hypothetical protein ACFQ07_25860, partial [Actinomadura adrarensis]
MTTAPSLVVAGSPDTARKLQSTGRFGAVFRVASATELRELSRNRRVRPPAAFMFSAEFEEDMPDAGVPALANGLAANGFTVVVHAFFSERGDVFDPRVVARTEPMTMSDLLEALGVPPADDSTVTPSGMPAGAAPDLLSEPPPESWMLTDEASAPGPTPASPDRKEEEEEESRSARNPQAPPPRYDETADGPADRDPTAREFTDALEPG